MLWVCIFKEIHHVIWKKKLKFVTIIIFPYYKLSSFNMSYDYFHHCLRQVWVTELRCVSVCNIFFQRWTLHLSILNHLIINVSDLKPLCKPYIYDYRLWWTQSVFPQNSLILFSFNHLIDNVSLCLSSSSNRRPRRPSLNLRVSPSWS